MGVYFVADPEGTLVKQEEFRISRIDCISLKYSSTAVFCTLKQTPNFISVLEGYFKFQLTFLYN